MVSKTSFSEESKICILFSTQGPRAFCVFQSPQSKQGILEHHMLPTADKVDGDADFYFPAGPASCPHIQINQRLVQWPWCYSDWWASYRSWLQTYTDSCHEEDTRLKRLSNQAGLPLRISSATDWMAQCQHIDAVTCAQGDSSKYRVHI